MAEIIVLTTPDNETGFRLAGFSTMTISVEQATTALDNLSKEGKYGLVCIEELLYVNVKKEIVDRIRKKGLPVIMPLHIPNTFNESGTREGHIARLIRRTIGYQVKLKK